MNDIGKMLSTISVDHLNEAVERVLRSETESQHSVGARTNTHTLSNYTSLSECALNTGNIPVPSLPLVRPLESQMLVALTAPINCTENSSLSASRPYRALPSTSMLSNLASYPGASDIPQYPGLPPMLLGGRRPQPIQPMSSPLPPFVLPRQTYASLVPYHPTRQFTLPPPLAAPSFQTELSALDVPPFRDPSSFSLPSMAAFSVAPCPSVVRSIVSMLPMVSRDDAMTSEEEEDSEEPESSAASSFGNPSSVQEINVVDVLEDDENTRDLIGSLALPNRELFDGHVTGISKDDLPSVERSAEDSVFDFILHSEAAVAPDAITEPAVVNDDQNIDTPTTDTVQYKPTYKGTYCVDCNRMYLNGCTQHPSSYQCLSDTPVCSRARRSIPSQLRLRSINNCSEPNFIGVLTVEMIPRRTRFGPLVGLMTRKEDLIRPTETAYIWQLFDENEPSKVLDCRDEGRANWLMFVKRARCSGEQNVMVCQEGEHIVFVTNTDVQPHTELLYWYASDYAQMLGVATRPEDFFSCSKCGLRCDSASELSAHTRRMHLTTARKWTCDMCGRKFSAACKLRTHMHTHLGMKPHACTHCEKRFADASNLRMHLRLHTDERKYSCTVCHRAFRQKSHLNAHMPVHSGVRAWQCRFCERMFARTSDVRQHERMHTRDRVHTCMHAGCGKVFWKLQNYKRHLRVHAKVLNHPCPRCDKGFASNYHMKRHLAVCKGTKRPPTIGSGG